jgi:hypothetical protein
MKKIHYAIYFVLALALIKPAVAVEPELISVIPGTPNNVKSIGTTSFYAVNNGLLIMDESELNNPQMLSFVSLPEACGYIDIQGDHAFVTAGQAGMYVIDISNPQQAMILGNYRFNNTTPAYAVLAMGNYVYIAYGMAGVRVADVSDPYNPVEVAYYIPADPDIFSQIIYTGTHLISNIGSTLYIFDISNPVNLQLLTTKTVYGSVSDMAAMNNKLIVLSNKSDFSGSFYGPITYDISNIYSINQVSQYNTGAYAYKLHMNGNYAYIGNGTLGVSVVQVDFLGLINPVGVIDGFAAPVRFCAADDDRARVGGEKIGLNYFNLTAPAVFEAASAFPLLFDSRDVVVNGNYAYIADGRNGLAVIDISNPYSPKILGQAPNTGNGLAVALNGNYAYIADGQTGVREYSITNPTQPALIGAVQTANWAQDIVIRNNIGYVAVDVSGMQLLNLSIPGLPGTAGPAYNLSGTSYGISLSGNYAITSSGGAGIHLVDVSLPSAPLLKGTYNTPGTAYDVCVVDETAFVADAQGGLVVVDISNPAAPFGLGQSTLPTNARRVFVSNSKAYIADWNKGLMVLDVSDFTNMPLLAEVAVSGTAHNLSLAGGFIYVASGNGGLSIYHNPFFTGISDDKNVAEVSLSVYPNPVHLDFILQIEAKVAEQAALSLFDFTGRSMLAPISIWLNQGLNTVNSRELYGFDSLPSGIYILHLSGGDFATQTKVLKR